jgi:hypothetical protein
VVARAGGGPQYQRRSGSRKNRTSPVIQIGEKYHATRTNCSGRISHQGADVPDSPAGHPDNPGVLAAGVSLLVFRVLNSGTRGFVKTKPQGPSG